MKSESKTKTTRRVGGSARKKQIIQATLQVVAKHGVHGATTSRIASAVGVSEAALYYYFKNRSQILVAALDAVYEKVFDVIGSSQQSDVIERLRDITQFHSALVSSEPSGFVYPLFEFVAAAPSGSLRKALGTRQMKAVDAVASIVREGQQQGSIVSDADPEQVAWQLISVAWAEDIASLMGLERFTGAGRGKRMVDLILTSISSKIAAR